MVAARSLGVLSKERDQIPPVDHPTLPYLTTGQLTAAEHVERLRWRAADELGNRFRTPDQIQLVLIHVAEGSGGAGARLLDAT